MAMIYLKGIENGLCCEEDAHFVMRAIHASEDAGFTETQRKEVTGNGPVGWITVTLLRRVQPERGDESPVVEDAVSVRTSEIYGVGTS